MEKITLDYSQALDFLEQNEITALQQSVSSCQAILHDASGTGSDYLGWVDLPDNYDKTEFSKLKAAAKRISSQSDVFIVVGIGGSYLGARAAIEMLNCNGLPGNKQGPEVYFAGHNISTSYLKNLRRKIEGKDISINVISKSGTTTEPAIVFRLLKAYMEDKYGQAGASQRISVTTDKSKGALKQLADLQGYETFVIPDNIGGRYSVLTSVGLLPMAVAGIDIDALMQGGQAACRDLSIDSLEHNPAYEYAAIRNILYAKGKTTEVMVNYEPNLFYLGEWYKQLFGESEGKDGKGIFPATMSFTTDLHAMGQYIQDGRKNIFETTLHIEKSAEEIIIQETVDNLDGLNYLQGKTLDYVNKKAMEGAMSAHVAGGVPNLMINIPEISPYYLGYLVYFLQKACAMSGYLLGVNPFDQPGVEAYKTNMFRILGKPGY